MTECQSYVFLGGPGRDRHAARRLDHLPRRARPASGAQGVHRPDAAAGARRSGRGRGSEPSERLLAARRHLGRRHRAQEARALVPLDIESCTACGARLRILSCIEDRRTIDAILTHLARNSATKGAGSSAWRAPRHRSEPARAAPLAERAGGGGDDPGGLPTRARLGPRILCSSYTRFSHGVRESRYFPRDLGPEVQRLAGLGPGRPRQFGPLVHDGLLPSAEAVPGVYPARHGVP